MLVLLVITSIGCLILADVARSRDRSYKAARDQLYLQCDITAHYRQRAIDLSAELSALAITRDPKTGRIVKRVG